VGSLLLSQPILTIEICLDQASRIPGFLSKKLGLYNSSLSHAINKLIDEKLVEKWQDPQPEQPGASPRRTL
jgi:DNA-binding MarR family transcriptional regulator